MIEDRSFNEFVRAKLEEDVGEIPVVVAFPPFRHSVFPAFLKAAALAAICGLLVSGVIFRHRESRRERDAICAIELMDIGSMSASSGSYADRLLAWQDVPYVEILD